MCYTLVLSADLHVSRSMTYQFLGLCVQGAGEGLYERPYATFV
jgi:hypothetical protein